MLTKIPRIVRKLAVVLASLVIGSPVFAQKIVKLGHFGPGSDPFSRAVVDFAKQVDEQSGGTLKVRVFPAGQLGNEKQQIGAMQGGTQEMLITTTANLTNINEKFRLIDLPFAFTNYKEVDAVMMGPMAPKLMADLESSKLVGLALWDNGFRVITNSRRPVTRLSDLKGLKMRVIGAPVFIDTFTALGTNPVPLPFPELFSALETRTVDGQDNPMLTVEMLKFYEAQKYVTQTNHIYSALVVLAGKPFHDALTPKEREALAKAMANFAARQRQLMRSAETKAIEFLVTEGKMQMVKSLGASELAEIRAAVQPVVDKTVTSSLRPLYDEMNQTIKNAK